MYLTLCIENDAYNRVHIIQCVEYTQDRIQCISNKAYTPMHRIQLIEYYE